MRLENWTLLNKIPNFCSMRANLSPLHHVEFSSFFFLTGKGWYTYDVHENCPILKIPTPCLSMFKILPLPWSNTSNFKRIPSPTSPTSPENYNQSIKRKHKPRTTIASYQQVNKSIIIKGWLYCLTSESKGRFLVSNVLMLGSALFLVMAQIHFPLIKK